MLDQFLATQLDLAPGGVVAGAGAWRFAFLSSTRDSDQLVDADRPVLIWCELELDLQQGTLQALAFSSEERRALYRALRAIGGIGRRSAFAVLDAGEVIDTLRAVAGNDTDYFKPVPGLGPKKIAGVLDSLGKRYGGHLPQPLPVSVALLVEARDALVQEGYPIAQAEQMLITALGTLPSPIRTSEAWLSAVDR